MSTQIKNANANRPVSQPKTSPTPPTPATAAGEGVQELSTNASASAAATFERKAPRAAPFGPPASPKLLNEQFAKPEDRELIRDHNRATIRQYNKDYAAYLERYTQGVESARSLDTVRAFGPPVSYSPGELSLPVNQRAQYDKLLEPSLALASDVRAAIGKRELKELGVKTPEAYLFVEGKVGFFGQGVKGRGELDHTGNTRSGTTLEFGAPIPDEITILGQEIPALGIEVDPFTGEAVGTVSASAGIVGLEADTKGKVTLSIGPQVDFEAFGQEAEAKYTVNSSVEPGAARVETSVKGAVKIGDIGEIELEVGAGAGLFNKEFVKAAIDPKKKDFFDVLANRVAGR